MVPFVEHMEGRIKLVLMWLKTDTAEGCRRQPLILHPHLYVHPFTN